jgi:hypothetical protein
MLHGKTSVASTDLSVEADSRQSSVPVHHEAHQQRLACLSILDC